MTNRKVSGEEILNLWKTTPEPIGVYIHSPFCKEQCSYCVFKGTIFNKHTYRQYYEDYLPRMIDFYSEVLASARINGFFFGGGTPTLMSPDEMRNLFDLIPNFKSQPNKLMEMHVCDWSKEQLDVLREYNFNIVVVCVQTFDSETLKKQKRRVPKSIDEVCENIRYANSIGLNTCSDLIYFDTGDIAKDSGRLINDIELLANNGTTEITISTIFNEDGKFDNLVTAIGEKFIESYPEYTTFSTYRGPVQGPEIEINYRASGDMFPRAVCYRMYRRDSNWREIFHWLPQLEEMKKWPNLVPQEATNTLGIGSYQNYKYTFSTIEDRIEYIEIGNLSEPEWHIIYDKNDYPTKKLIADFQNGLEELIGEPPDGITFSFSTQIATEDEHEQSKRVKRELLVSIEFPDFHNFKVQEYENNFRSHWPTISKQWQFIKIDNLKERIL
tara:strand:+ start:819 stop:2141 length:1323 start_codon:yes stop_codon:yes gene_type:complete